MILELKDGTMVQHHHITFIIPDKYGNLKVNMVDGGSVSIPREEAAQFIQSYKEAEDKTENKQKQVLEDFNHSFRKMLQDMNGIQEMNMIPEHTEEQDFPSEKEILAMNLTEAVRNIEVWEKQLPKFQEWKKGAVEFLEKLKTETITDADIDYGHKMMEARFNIFNELNNPNLIE